MSQDIESGTPSGVVETQETTDTVLDANGTSSAAAVDANEPSEGAADQTELNLDGPVPEEGKADLLSVVQDVVTPPSQEGDPASEGEEKSEAAEQSSSSEGEDGSDKDEDIDSDADEQVPFHEHPRWQQLLKERDDYKEQAKQYGEIQDFMEANSLATQEVSEGFRVMGMMKNNPREALPFLRHYVAQVETFLGETLPPELQQRVDEGFLTREDALTMSRTQGQVRQAEYERDITASRQGELQQQQQKQAIVNAVNDWATQIASTDPDYLTQKQPLVRDALQALVAQHGQPRNETEAVQMANEALKRVEAHIAPLRPKPAPKPATTPLTSTTTAGVPRGEPKTLQEAIANAASSGS